MENRQIALTRKINSISNPKPLLRLLFGNTKKYFSQMFRFLPRIKADEILLELEESFYFHVQNG